MTLDIEAADLSEPQLQAFLAAHRADLAPTAPPESRHALDSDAFASAGVRLFVGRLDGEIVVSGALAALSAEHEEVKSMRTDPGYRGRGYARKMLSYLLQNARSRGVLRVSLETGSMDFFAPARQLYEGEGFTRCEPFGRYQHDPNSVYMSRDL